MKQKIILIPIALILTALLFTGCSDRNTLKNTLPETDPPNVSQNLPQDDSASPKEADTIDLESSNLQAEVVNLLENGVTARPVTITETSEGGSLAEVPLEDDTADIDVIFSADTAFSLIEIDMDTFEKTLHTAEASDVKKTTSIHVWGSYSGVTLTADKVVILRFV